MLPCQALAQLCQLEAMATLRWSPREWNPWEIFVKNTTYWRTLNLEHDISFFPRWSSKFMSVNQCTYDMNMYMYSYIYICMYVCTYKDNHKWMEMAFFQRLFSLIRRRGCNDTWEFSGLLAMWLGATLCLGRCHAFRIESMLGWTHLGPSDNADNAHRLVPNRRYQRPSD